MVRRQPSRQPRRRRFKKRYQQTRNFKKAVRAVIGGTKERHMYMINYSSEGQTQLPNYVTETLTDANWYSLDLSPVISLGDTIRDRTGDKIYLNRCQMNITLMGGAVYNTTRMIVVQFKHDPVDMGYATLVESLYRGTTTDATNNFGLNSPIAYYGNIHKVIFDRVFNITRWDALLENYTRHFKIVIKANHVANFNTADIAGSRTTGPYWYYAFILATARVPAASYILMTRAYKWSFKEV